MLHPKQVVECDRTIICQHIKADHAAFSLSHLVIVVTSPNVGLVQSCVEDGTIIVNENAVCPIVFNLSVIHLLRLDDS